LGISLRRVAIRKKVCFVDLCVCVCTWVLFLVVDSNIGVQVINELLAPTQQRKDVVLSHVMASSARRRTELYMKKKEKKRKASLARGEK